ncbi:MAG: hypothetical protein ACREE7_05870 [Dongiaceae bacterium]
MRKSFRGGTLALAMLGLTALGLRAEDQSFLTLDQISKTIIGNTMTGQAKDGGGYAEYYAPDGVIRGQSEKGGAYKGSWWLRKEDNLMCFKYGDGPFDAGCARLALAGDRVDFVLMDGTMEGTATLLTGNPRKL